MASLRSPGSPAKKFIGEGAGPRQLVLEPWMPQNVLQHMFWWPVACAGRLLGQTLQGRKVNGPGKQHCSGWVAKMIVGPS